MNISFLYKAKSILMITVVLISLVSCNEEFTNNCPLLFIEEVSDQNQNQFTFVVTIEGDDSEISLQWLLDSIPITIEDGINGNLEARTFTPQGLEPGEHFVDVNYESPTCPQSVNNGLSFTVLPDSNANCKNLFFTSRLKNGSATRYIFKADFEGRDEIDYDWYIDDVFIESEVVGNEDTNHRLNYNFPEEFKEYNVCIKSRPTSCGIEASYCTNIAVNPYLLCPGFDNFTEEVLDNNTNQYQITALFTEDVTGDYIWELNGVVIPENDQVTVSPREFYIITNLESGDNFIKFFPRNEACPEDAGPSTIIAVP